MPLAIGQLQKILGLLGYYRRYIQEFANSKHSSVTF